MALLATVTAVAAPAMVPPCTLDRAIGTTIDPEPFLTHGYGTRWNLATNRLVFMQPDQSGYYQVWSMRPDGSERRNLTSGRPGLATRAHHGAPFWEPSGRYLLFVAQKPDWHGTRLFGSPDYEALPGFGRHDDLWLITADGQRLWKLTDRPNTRDEGILLPVFSPDGKQIAWSERQPGGKYVLTVADFIERPEPHLHNLHLSPREWGLLRARLFYERQRKSGLHQRPGYPQLLAWPDLPALSGQRSKPAPDGG
jgi:hypothetical protein